MWGLEHLGNRKKLCEAGKDGGKASRDQIVKVGRDQMCAGIRNLGFILKAVGIIKGFLEGKGNDQICMLSSIQGTEQIGRIKLGG